MPSLREFSKTYSPLLSSFTQTGCLKVYMERERTPEVMVRVRLGKRSLFVGRCTCRLHALELATQVILV